MINVLSKNKPTALKSLMIASVFMLVLLIIQPFLWKMVKTRARVLHEKRTQAAQIEEVKQKIKNIQENYDNQRVFIDQLTAVVPKSRNALQVIERLETASQGLNVNLEVSRIDESVPMKSIEDISDAVTAKNNLGPVESGNKEMAKQTSKTDQIFPLLITLTVTGRPEALVEYIDAVEHVQELSRIQKFTLSPAPTDVGNQQPSIEQNNFQLLMTVIFYLQGTSDAGSN